MKSEHLPRTTRGLFRLPNKIERRELQLPELGEGMLFIEVKSSLISPGSELGGWSAFQRGELKPPHDVPFGYSNSGIVKAIGDGVTGFNIGERVVSIGAGYAPHAEHCIASAALTIKLPKNVSHDEGAFAMLLATALHGVRNSHVQLGSRVAVAGLGLLGNLSSQIFNTAGCRVAGWEVDDNAIALAKAVGIEFCSKCHDDNCISETREWTNGEGLDVACWAMSGDANELWRRTVSAMQLSPDGHPMGRLVIIGHPTFTFQSRPMTNIEIVQASRTGPGYHDPEYEAGSAYPSVFVRWDTRRNLEYCFELVAKKMIQLKPLITHHVSMDNAEEEFHQLSKSDTSPFGVIIQMNRDKLC